MDAPPALVSVLMPIYNCEAYLRATLDSLTIQTLPDFEAILVDDGSTDSSADIIREYAEKDSRFKLVSQKNQGIVAALNHGLAKAQGKYIARLDGDDIAHLDRFKKQLEYLETHPECVCVGSLYRAINEKGELLWQQKVFANIKQTNLKTYPPLVTTLPHPSIMLRRADLEKLGGYRPDFPHAEDFDLFLRLSRLGRLEVVPDYLLDYRVHQSSLSSKNLGTQLDSALKALMAAVLHQATAKDPFDDTQVSGNASTKPDLNALFEQLPDHKTQAFFRFLKELRLAAAWMNRGDLSQAKTVLTSMYAKLIAQSFSLACHLRYWQLLAAMTRMWLKIKLKRI